MQEFRTDIDPEVKCGRCGSQGYVLEKKCNPLHGHARRCTKCDFAMGWNGKVKNINKRTQSKFDCLKDEIGKCQMCGRPKHMLFKGDSLEIHHIEEIQNGGKDERENVIVLCTGCHKLTHWIRIYHFNHIAPLMEAYENAI